VYPLLLALGWFDVLTLSSPLVAPLAAYITYPVAWLLVIGTFYLLPDAFAFLVWETKENWSLYRANRGLQMWPVAIGAHGESVRGLLEPGFHSGTVPRLYTRLRDAERRAFRSRDWNAARWYRKELEHIEAGFRRFVDRELLGLLRQSSSWQGQRLAVGPVHLAINRIRFELDHDAYPTQP